MPSDLGKALTVFEREGPRFDIVFVDPPYEKERLYAETLMTFGTRSLLAEGGLLVIEHSKRTELAEGAGSIRRYRVLTQGDSTLSFYQAESV